MTCEVDGQVRCDGCGVLDEDVRLELRPGWTRTELKPRVYRHYCPVCLRKKGADE